MRSRIIELVACAAAIAAAWWLAGVATDAWHARVTALGLQAPAGARDAARTAAIYFTAGAGVLGIARVFGRRGGEPIAVPWLVPAMLVAVLFGLAMQLATVEVARGVVQLPTAAPFAQGFLFGVIAGAAILFAPIDLGELVTRAQLPLALAIGAIFLALAVAGSGPAGSGTRINLGPVQPIELVKPLAVAFLAAYLGTRASKLRWQRRKVLGLRWLRVELLAPAVVVLLAIVGALYVVGDLGPVLLLAVVFLGMFFVASRATGWVVVAFAVLAGVLVLFALVPSLAGGGTVKTRLVMWSDPWTNGLSNGAQLGEGLWALAAGGWDGQGLARGLVPIVPAGKTDLALATLGEQLGARALVAYHGVLASIVLAALYVAARARTAVRALMAGGIAIMIAAQWTVILGGTLGHLPLTGIVVPFVSTGRSSMAAFVVMVALVARLAADGRARAASQELDELHAASRAVRIAVLVALAVGVVTTLYAMLAWRTDTSARGIVARLADGTRVHRMNPRLVALAAQIKRGSILDRNGVALASSTPRTYPLGDDLGTLLGVHPARRLLPPWAIERVHNVALRGYGERGGVGLPYPDYRELAPLLDLDDRTRAAAIAKRPGRDVKLTLDARLQAAVAKLASGSKRLAVAAVVIDVDSGHVLARVQVPDYDPNKPQWTFGAYGTWSDKTGVHGMFQSGSVGKIFTALAAIRAGRASARYECKESDAQGPLFTLPRWHKPIHDHHGDRPHGIPDLVQAMAVSCNVYFGQLGLEIGAAPFAELRKLGVDVGYTDVLDAGAPQSRQLASTAYGQGAMVMSVMQAARLTAAIAAGGVYRRCAMELDAACTSLSLGVDVQPIVDGMRRVMTAGTGARLTQPAGVRVYGKTGTADVRGFAGEEPFGIARGHAAAPHSWFVAFAEATTTQEGAAAAPGRIAVAVVVPRGGTGASAAGPLAMQIIAAAREHGYVR